MGSMPPKALAAVVPMAFELTLSYRGEGERQIRTTLIRTVKKEKQQREKDLQM
jgi:hypothetical protein